MSWARTLSTFFPFLLLLPTVRSQIINATATKYSYDAPNFDGVASNITPRYGLQLFGDAGQSQGALQLTPDSIGNLSHLQHKSGRIFLQTPFKLWEDDATAAGGRRVASFNTTFSVNIYSVGDSPPGEGLAFLITSSLGPPPPGSEGGYLGLTNATLNGNVGNSFVAVELDTFRDADLGDPNGNHVGLDINGVNSTRTGNLSFPLATNSSSNTVWIDYDGAARHVWVYVALQHSAKPAAATLDAPLDLGKILLQKYSYFGFAGSTDYDAYELNCVLSWNLTVDVLPGDDGTPWKLIAIVVGAAVFVAGLAGGIFFRMYSRRRRRAVADASGDGAALVIGALKSLPGMPKEFSFKELNRATNNFDETMKLGKGGFGEVYRGVLQEENREVAVKRFSRGSSGPDDFLKELTIINRLRHKHLVPLVGWCHTNGVLLLVYEYMPNGSLDQHLFVGGGGGGDEEAAALSWERRYNVISGVASALQYLHEEYDQRVVHRDLKASNVMLDACFNARLGDFGLARAIETDKTSYAELTLGGVPGTLGYIAPECFHTGKATRESDIFSFGAVVLEVVCGRRPRCDVGEFKFLSDWVWKLHRERRIVEAVDPRLLGAFDGEEAKRLLLLGLACSHPIPTKRPKTTAVVQILSRSVAPPVVPDFKPAFVWQSDLPEAEEDPLVSSSSAVTSSYYASSASGGWSQSSVGTEGRVGPKNTFDSMV